MQRRVRTYVTSAALAVSLIGGLTACTDASDNNDGEGARPGPSTTASAAPGKYRTLPEPCGAVSTDLLKTLLPGAGGSTDDSDAPYGGEPSVTYDTDRRVGCTWKSSTTLGSRHLSVDLERVVSYDPAVSDDEQAELLYDERASQAGIPTPEDEDTESPGTEDDSTGTANPDAQTSESADDSATPEDGQDGHSGQDGQSGNQTADESGAADDPSAKDTSEADNSGKGKEGDESGNPEEEGEDLAPRSLDGIGQSAFIDDRPGTGDSGVHRDITVVFRTANVIATIRYDQWLTDKKRTPDSRELQEQAQKVARELASGFDED